MKKICKNCAFWDIEDIYDSFPNYHPCFCPKIKDFWQITQELHSVMGEDELLAPLDNILVTGAEFGCIHFEEKEDL
jgi:hypothetical protein